MFSMTHTNFFENIASYVNTAHMAHVSHGHMLSPITVLNRLNFSLMQKLYLDYFVIRDLGKGKVVLVLN
jgi:hypothetical protein